MATAFTQRVGHRRQMNNREIIITSFQDNWLKVKRTLGSLHTRSYITYDNTVYDIPGFKQHLLSVVATKKASHYPAVNFATKTTSQHSHVIYQTKAKGVLYTY